MCTRARAPLAGTNYVAGTFTVLTVLTIYWQAQSLFNDASFRNRWANFTCLKIHHVENILDVQMNQSLVDSQKDGVFL